MGKVKKILPVIGILIFLVVIFTPMHFAHAAPWYDLAGGAVDSILSFVGSIILKITGFILWIAGTLLNFVLDYTIVGMADHVNKMTGINAAWKVVRDLMNIAFVFMLLYYAILMILGFGGSGKVKSFIIGIVLASILVNFSLFFTKVLIDASNVVTIGIYKNIVGDDSGVSGLSNKYMTVMRLPSVFDPATLNSWALPGNDAKSIIIIGLGGSVLFIITAFVFFAISVLFIVRYLVLIMLLMLSPVAYMGLARLPGIQSYSKQWWDSLTGQLVFAPLFMIMTWIVLTLISNDGFFGGNSSVVNGNSLGQLFNSTSAPPPESIGLLLNFVLVIGLAIATLTTAKTWATKGAKQIGDFSGKAMSFAGGAVFGGTAWAGRNTIGRWGKNAADDAELQRRARENTGLSGASARLKLYAAQTARSGSFDARNAQVPTSVIGDAIEGTVGRTGVGRALGLNDVNIPNIGSTSTIADIAGIGRAGTKGFKEVTEERNRRIGERDGKAASELQLAQARQDVLNGSKPGATRAEIDAMEQALSKLSDKQTEALVESNRQLLASQNFANAISVKQLEVLNKSDKLSDVEKDTLKNERFKEIRTIIDPAGLAALAIPAAARTPAQVANAKRIEDARAKVKGLSDSELEMVGGNYLDPSTPEGKEFIAQLRPAQAEAITNNKGGKFSSTQKDNVKKERMRPLMDALTTRNGPVIQSIIRKANIKTLVGFIKTPGVGGVNIAFDSEVIPTYTVKTLQRIASHEDATDDDIHNLRLAILGPTGTGAPGANPGTVAWLLDPAKGMIEFP